MLSRPKNDIQVWPMKVVGARLLDVDDGGRWCATEPREVDVRQEVLRAVGEQPNAVWRHVRHLNYRTVGVGLDITRYHEPG